MSQKKNVYFACDDHRYDGNESVDDNIYLTLLVAMSQICGPNIDTFKKFHSFYVAQYSGDEIKKHFEYEAGK